jgi:hypothetical protein
MGGERGKGGEVGGAWSSPEVRSLASSLQQQGSTLFSQSQPVTQQLLAQMSEALSTGGVGAQIPLIQKSVEASRQATSQGLREAEELGARTGGGRGSSALSNTLGQLALQGNLATSQITTNIASQFIAAAPGFALGNQGQALGFQGGAGNIFNVAQGIQAQRDIANGQQQSSMLSSLGGLGMAAGAAAFT